MRTKLIVLFGMIWLAMVVVTVRASMAMPIWEAFNNFADHPWAVATLWDAYFGFLTFYVWVAYKEPNWTAKLAWLVLILTLGNIAMSGYVLRELWRMQEGESWETLLTRRGMRN